MMHDDFDRNFNTVMRIAMATYIIVLLAGLGLASFAVWVVYRLLLHFGVI